MLRNDSLFQLLWVFSLTCGLSATAGAQPATFRVETSIFEGSSKDAVAKHLILFDGGLVYDLPIIEDRFVTVYDSPRKRVILLDRQTKTRSTIGIEDLVRITAQARSAAETREQQARLGILATPEFDPDASVYSIEFGEASYKTTVQETSDVDIALQYGQFADLASRLNLVRRIGLPPFARMSLNQRIATDGKMPKETSLAIRRGIAVDRFRSTHQVIAYLSQSDRKQIEEAGSMLALYNEVGLEKMQP
ncbi:hypothetical protein [Novipirellula artificiosorum]|uniref:DUF4412 domain-containing protein n=1 Tax=Novipirellula artificiosorum TaxID=2528016 RepID=A0A5C6DIS5_9BACT|nr:hypothetical protein [Novipirellula artificiosorum]TWU36115.1 hypothetical protein Poly41_38680 [Novipirellula artificiosorum]